MSFKIKGYERIFCIGHSVINNLNEYLIPSIKGTRASIRYIGKNNGNKKLIGAEIGVREGYNAKSILTQLQIKKLYLVDPFIPYIEQGLLKPSVPIEFAEKTLSKFKDKIEFIPYTSKQASKILPDNLDFVYIDGCHESESVREDMNLWYKKLKIKGILAGHDLNTPRILKEFMKFCKDKELVFALEKDWWVIKDGEKKCDL